MLSLVGSFAKESIVTSNPLPTQAAQYNNIHEMAKTFDWMQEVLSLTPVHDLFVVDAKPAFTEPNFMIPFDVYPDFSWEKERQLRLTAMKGISECGKVKSLAEIEKEELFRQKGWDTHSARGGGRGVWNLQI